MVSRLSTNVCWFERLYGCSVGPVERRNWDEKMAETLIRQSVNVVSLSLSGFSLSLETLLAKEDKLIMLDVVDHR